MNRIKYISAVIIALCMTALYVISSTDLVLKEQEDRIYHISVIFNDVRDEYYVNFKKGVKQTFSEWSTDVNYVTLYEPGDGKQQMELMEREIANGADAVILFPVDHETMAQLFEGKVITVPVICVGSDPEGGYSDACIYGNNEGNGRLLAQQIALDLGEDRRKVYLLTSYLGRGDILELRQGICRELEEKQLVHETVLYDSPESLTAKLKEIYGADRKAVFVSLDIGTQEAILDAASLVENSACSFYTAGATDRVLDYISRGKIRAAVVNNEFDMGYLSIRTAVSLLNQHSAAKEYRVQSILVTQDNMFQKENEKILFPME